MTIRNVAEKIGVPATTYRDWEYGNAITGEPYVKLAEVFEISIYELLTGNRPDRNKIIEDMAEVIELQKKIINKLNSIF